MTQSLSTLSKTCLLLCLLATSCTSSKPDATPATQSNTPATPTTAIHWWTSSENLQTRLTQQPDLHFTPNSPQRPNAIHIDDTTRFQTILGLGSSLEHSTCYNLSLLPPNQRERILESLVHPTQGIGMNLMRICIGTSDFAPGPFYTYDDMPPGQEDPELKHFSIDRDREYLLPSRPP